MNVPDARLMASRGPKPPLPPLPAVLQDPRGKNYADPVSVKLIDTNSNSAELATNFALCQDDCPLRGVGALQRGAAGPVAHSIFSASKARKLRAKDSVVGLTETSDPHNQIERSELCRECRPWVWRWAAGAISGKQCMLHLELSNSVRQLVQQARSQRTGSSTSPPSTGRLSALWLVGCVSSSAAADVLETLRYDLENRSPNEMLLQAWEALEHEFGTAAGRLGTDEINLALRRLSVSKGGGTFGKVPSDPSAFLRVQVWRELIRIHLGAVEGDVSCSSICPADEFLDDTDILRFVSHTEPEFRELLSSLSLPKLVQRAAFLTNHAATMKQMQQALRAALQDWTRFDPWKVLGLSRTASLAEARKAFFKKALQLHPDKGGGKAQFQELQRAYDEVLAELGAQRASPAEEEGEESEEQERSQNCSTNKSADPKSDDKEKGKQQRTEENDEEDDETIRKNNMSQERQAFVEGGSMRWLQRLAAKVAAAAEAAGDQATGALRHCHAATEALERTPPECVRASANMEAALRVVRKLSQASSLAADYLRQASEAIDIRLNLVSPQLGPSTASSNEIAQAVHDASASVKLVTDSCLCAVAQTVKALQSMEFSGPRAGRSQARVHEALSALADACKRAAVSSIDAAETIAKTIQALESAARGDSSTETRVESDVTKMEPPNDKAEDEPEQSETNTGETKPEPQQITEPEDGNKQQKQSEIAQEDRERQQAVRELREVRQVLRRSNMDLLELQRSGWKLAEDDESALPHLPVDCHNRTFGLLAEFLDEAARHFHEVLRRAPQGQEEEDRNDEKIKQKGLVAGANASCAAWIMDALDQTFGFWLRSSPELAVTSDPRTSVLRASVALDAVSVRCMLQSQVAKRLEGVVSLVLLESGRLPKRPATLAGNEFAGQDPFGAEGSAAVAAVHKALSDALTRLERGPAAVGGG